MSDATRLCPICGLSVPNARRKYCSPECAKVAHRKQAVESQRRHYKPTGNPIGRKKSDPPVDMTEYKRIRSAQYRQAHPDKVRQNEARYKEKRVARLGAEVVASHLRAMDRKRREMGRETRATRGKHPIAIARAAIGMTQKDLANAAGVSVGSVRNWEEYVVTPRMDMLKKVAAALAVDEKDLK